MHEQMRFAQIARNKPCNRRCCQLRVAVARPAEVDSSAGSVPYSTALLSAHRGNLAAVSCGGNRTAKEVREHVQQSRPIAGSRGGVIDGNAPATAHVRHRRRYRGGWPRSRLRLAIFVAGFAAVTVAVPWMVAQLARQMPSTALASDPSMVAPSSETARPSFTPISVQAEDPGNTLSGGAAIVACATCEGGYRVRYLCASCRLVVRTRPACVWPQDAKSSV